MLQSSSNWPNITQATTILYKYNSSIQLGTVSTYLEPLYEIYHPTTERWNVQEVEED